MKKKTDLSTLGPVAGSRPAGKRKGRGAASGVGRSSCRGEGGSNKRSGYRRRPAFEGGQMPLVRRLPKRGFSNALFKKEFDVVNIANLQEKFKSGEKVTPAKLKDLGLTGGNLPVKILGTGELKKKLSVSGCQYSASAKEKIISAGGSLE
ncbi:MAG: 50S ribosomal protein L15 [Elusimicrobia bacterium]|nr:50S ribosomal protein L15 [Elusimicrobiota bacterium]